MPPRATILCVDDDEVGLRVRTMLLQRAGYAVQPAESGRRAIEIIGSDATFDLAILDYLMPGMNGDEVARHLRRDRPQCPIILLSAHPDLDSSITDLADHYVRKGQNPEVLLGSIEQLLHR